MAFKEITYLVLVGEKPQEYPQTADQACQAVGVHFVTGLPVHRYDFRTPAGDPCVVVVVYGSNALFGAYIFTGRM
ncbi:hypothetical protein OG381_34495 [Streptomyces sp. NBC_00490]|uniref:hypothetical protein n=1 Tax=Streptomyces sp. NBC_00490 TaxID=2903657 RepID=UPI002E18EC3B